MVWQLQACPLYDRDGKLQTVRCGDWFIGTKTLEATVFKLRDSCSSSVCFQVNVFCLWPESEDLMAKFIGTLVFEQFQPCGQWEMEKAGDEEATKAAWDQVVLELLARFKAKEITW